MISFMDVFGAIGWSIIGRWWRFITMGSQLMTNIAFLATTISSSLLSRKRCQSLSSMIHRHEPQSAISCCLPLRLQFSACRDCVFAVKSKQVLTEVYLKRQISYRLMFVGAQTCLFSASNLWSEPYPVKHCLLKLVNIGESLGFDHQVMDEIPPWLSKCCDFQGVCQHPGTSRGKSKIVTYISMGNSGKWWLVTVDDGWK